MSTISWPKPQAWVVPLVLLVAAGTAMSAAAQQVAPLIAVGNTWLAARYDSTHVQIILESYSGPATPALNAMLAPTENQFNRPAAPCEPFCFPPISLDEATAFDHYLRQHSAQADLPPLVKPGDAFLIQLGNGTTVSAAVSRMLGTPSSDGYFLGALATVAPDDVPAWQAASAKKAFVAVRAGAALPSRLATLAQSASAAERRAITDLLQQQREAYVAGARAEMLHFGFHLIPQVPAAQAARLERLRQGEGSLETEITRVELASGEPRFYARAEWRVDGKATFAVGAWIALKPRPQVFWWDTEDAARCLLGGENALEDPGSGLARFPELLNVATLADGRTGLVLVRWGYEGFGLELDVFGDAGPRNTSVTGYGDGG